jgi:hypothetical protein
MRLNQRSNSVGFRSVQVDVGGPRSFRIENRAFVSPADFGLDVKDAGQLTLPLTLIVKGEPGSSENSLLESYATSSYPWTRPPSRSLR